MTKSALRCQPCAAVIAVIAALALLSCSSPPSGPDTAASPIRLSLEVSGRDTATYRGMPIMVLVRCDEPLSVMDLGWTMGNAQFYRDPYLDYGADSLREFSVLLKWTRLPASKDSLQRAFDSIFVTTGGGIKQSNTVRVYVVNIPPEIISLTVGNMSFDCRADFIDVGLDTSGPLTITVVVRDNDDLNDVAIDWASPLFPQRLNPVTGNKVIYAAPAGAFSDSIFLHVYDRDGGDVWKKMHIHNSGAYTRPVIEQIKAGGSVYAAVAETVFVDVYAIDTLRFEVTARDPQKGDSISYAWIASPRKGAKGLIASGPSAVYAFETGLFYVDAKVYSDTITVIASDTHGLSDRAVIVIKVRNRTPVIDSIRISGDIDTMLKGAAMARTITAKPGAKLGLRGYAHDPDAAYGDFLAYAWSNEGDTVNDRIMAFTCPAARGAARLTFTATDIKGVVAMRSIEFLIEETSP